MEKPSDLIGGGIFARTDGRNLPFGQEIASRRFPRVAAAPFLSGRMLRSGCRWHDSNHGTDPAGPSPATREHCADARCIPASSLFPGESPKAEHRRGIFALGRDATSCVKVQRDQTICPGIAAGDVRTTVNTQWREYLRIWLKVDGAGDDSPA